ncbi:hypothetical protein GGX14DRAFT_634651 [Mycena pura]|uniref:F-box domain-containing protein n=1 Tax=Mycena pura TaxID=153505 RepID=A0AAD6VB61_9AGAR|nr:hypothetical protein GGX14DRAFT_634651 [Mycena pura]
MKDPVGLLSFPNELLIIIFENPKFPVDYLCVLSALCRRLHFLALPIYFRRCGIPDPSKSVIIPLSKDGADMLAALSMALFLSSLQDITCMFPHPSCTSIFPLLPHLDRFRRFISRFPSVKRVTLQLDARNSLCNVVGDDAALRAWSATLGGLLNTLVERRCTELTVRYGGYLTRSYTLSAGDPRHPKRVRRALKAMKRLFRPRPTMSGKGWEFLRAPDQGRERALISASTRSSKLTTLHIQSAILVMPPCLNWTLSALRNCSITTLSLSQISLDKGLWGPTLSLIAMATPNLPTLSLSELDAISDEEILRFCARLPRLVSLKIGRNEEAQGTPTQCTKGRVPEFRNLACLVAPADFILYFLRAPQCFPKLQSLCIAFHGKTHIRSVGTQLGAVCKALAASKVAPSIGLSLALFSDTIPFDIDAAPSLSRDVTYYFSHVASLDLEVFPYNSAEIVRWIRLFSSVQHVSLNVRSKPADVEADAGRFLKAFSAEKSLLRSIAINGKRHNLYDLPTQEA